MKRQPPDVAAWQEKAVADFKKARDIGNLGEELELVKAQLALAEDRPDDVLSILTKLIDGGSKKEDYFKLRGDAWRKKSFLERQKSYTERALEDYTEAIRICANYYSARRFRGALYFELGRLEEAWKDFEEGMRINPTDSFALCDVGTFLDRTDRKAEALEYYQKAIDANPRNYRAWSNRGTVRMGRKDYAGARQDFQKALEIHPHYIPARNNLAIAHFYEGDEAGALRLLDEVIRDNPGVANAVWTRGQIHYQRGRWREAIADFEKAAEADPRLSDDAQRYIDDCRKRLGG
jgi:tetratricopeptide (TPR) repeat protein